MLMLSRQHHPKIVMNPSLNGASPLDRRDGSESEPTHSNDEPTDLAACNLAAGDLYKFPNASSTIDATQPVTFLWNTACTLSSPQVDIYLYAPSSSNGLIQAWTGADYTSGQFTVQLLPKWWNNTASARLQMTLVESGQPAWNAGTGPAGPVFTINYPTSAMTSTTASGVVTNSAGASASGNSVFQSVNNTANQSTGISKGAIAAAVIVPLLVVAGLLAVAIRFWRTKEQKKRRRWSQAMSSNSNLEWEKGGLPTDRPPRLSLGGAPGSPAMRNSTVGSLGRPSISSMQRPASLAASSVMAMENNMAGAGAGASFARPPYASMRSASADYVPSVHSQVHLPDGGIRQSRISFAETTRPDRRSRLSLGGDIRPAVLGKNPAASYSATDITPARRAAYATGSAVADDYEEDINISPSQVSGPGGWGDAEMRKAAKPGKVGRRSGLFGGSAGRRASGMSEVSADDFKSAASARGSVDELRDIEAAVRELWLPPGLRCPPKCSEMGQQIIDSTFTKCVSANAQSPVAPWSPKPPRPSRPSPLTSLTMPQPPHLPPQAPQQSPTARTKC